MEYLVARRRLPPTSVAGARAEAGGALGGAPAGTLPPRGEGGAREGARAQNPSPGHPCFKNILNFVGLRKGSAHFPSKSAFHLVR